MLSTRGDLGMFPGVTLTQKPDENKGGSKDRHPSKTIPSNLPEAKNSEAKMSYMVGGWCESAFLIGLVAMVTHRGEEVSRIILGANCTLIDDT